ncbi:MULTISPECIES: hypothetical protein [Microbacterium]|uniref:hypothetical protein n=1 Tax=Microbacterium TaxID=33882 RepID=UPI00277E8199|nr:MULTISPECIES: hypothetical protein [Microbacterium]MDQ1084525.1 hypothetical protein [Microbacterium sp. SORGH_AS_0344]MDQ1170198.1 hypothetical protein [Microbacterium proteolyticum]
MTAPSTRQGLPRAGDRPTSVDGATADAARRRAGRGRSSLSPTCAGRTPTPAGPTDAGTKRLAAVRVPQLPTGPAEPS